MIDGKGVDVIYIIYSIGSKSAPGLALRGENENGARKSGTAKSWTLWELPCSPPLND